MESKLAEIVTNETELATLAMEYKSFKMNKHDKLVH